MLDWDQYFMTLVYAVSMKSKDESTHIGAVIVGPDNEIRSTGYNSFPRGLMDKVKERQKRPEKYFYFEHAERNSIYNAARMGTSLNGCRMYTQGIPCADCARACIQAGLSEIIVHETWERNKDKKWEESASYSISMFQECEVHLRIWTGKIQPIYGLKRSSQLDIF